MKATVEVDLLPFRVPNFVLRAVGKDEGYDASLPISVLDAATLDRMCNEFRDAVFEKAGKQQPPATPRVDMALLHAVRNLVFHARTSGGTAGRDERLCAALDAVETLLAAPERQA